MTVDNIMRIFKNAGIGKIYIYVIVCNILDEIKFII